MLKQPTTSDCRDICAAMYRTSAIAAIFPLRLERLQYSTKPPVRSLQNPGQFGEESCVGWISAEGGGDLSRQDQSSIAESRNGPIL